MSIFIYGVMNFGSIYIVKFRDLLHSSIIFLDGKVIVHYFSRILHSYLGIKIYSIWRGRVISGHFYLSSQIADEEMDRKDVFEIKIGREKCKSFRMSKVSNISKI